MDPLFSLADLLDGSADVALYLHLGEVDPQLPYRLDTLQEATFEGYVPSPFITIARQGYSSGFGYVEGFGVFANNSQETIVPIRAAWLTARWPTPASPPVLLSVVASITGLLVQGQNTLQFRFTSFERA